ncbi:hypothetical protein KP509_09G017400 [Ceratopteris richardii]|nr:hypothetical protein KP509_09G017400 [Ceratopteris richardii]
MIELLTVTCLSLAAKMEEVEVPALLDLQGCDGLEHAFEAKTVQRMELNVLSALGWRLNSITPFSFAEKAINCFCIRHYLKNALMLRTSELLVSILQVPAFLEFEPSVIAVSSICFALEELIPSQVDQLKSYLFQLIPLEPESAKRCYVQMESLVVDPICTTTEEGSTKSPLSPNTVSYNEGADDSEGTSSYVASAVFLERIPLEDIILYPKRQRIC